MTDWCRDARLSRPDESSWEREVRVKSMLLNTKGTKEVRLRGKTKVFLRVLRPPPAPRSSWGVRGGPGWLKLHYASPRIRKGPSGRTTKDGRRFHAAMAKRKRGLF